MIVDTKLDTKAPLDDPAPASIPALAPPAYTSTSPPNPNLPNRQPHNRLRIQRDVNNIKDIYVIDPSLPGGTAEKNLSLQTSNGNVDAKVHLTGAGTGKRVEMEAASKYGDVKFAVCNRPADMAFHLSASCKNGNVALALPPTFRGPLSIRYKNGKVKFSPSFQPYVRTLEESSGQMQCWIGEWAGDGVDWTGDECVVENDYGDVKVTFWEAEKEATAQQPKSGGWLSDLFKKL